MIKRSIESDIARRMFGGKVIIVHGPRQSGKTTLVKQILKDYSSGILSLNGDESDTREVLRNATSTKLRNIAGSNKIVFIDEAQKITDIGTILKLFVDNLTDVQVIATGSSSFELANKTAEALTGRKWEYRLFPLSYKELTEHTNMLEESRLCEQRLIFGAYPEIVTKPQDSAALLKLLADSYLYKDLLAIETIRNPSLINKLVRALALQIGSEVSYNELAVLTGTNNNSVEKYIDLLEKAFIIFRLPAINRNVRNEIKKGKKFYFYDNGIRNAVIGNFNLLSQRTDVGALWENYVVSERMKRNVYADDDYFPYFWRTTQQQEIDYIEERQGDYFAYELKWNPKSKAKFSQTFMRNYPVKAAKVITPSNIEEFLL